MWICFTVIAYRKHVLQLQTELIILDLCISKIQLQFFKKYLLDLVDAMNPLIHCQFLCMNSQQSLNGVCSVLLNE